MLTFKRPMLAASLLPPSVEHTDENILAAMEKLRYPVLATLKKDGIRALRLNGSLLSRTLKPIPNKSIRERSLVMPGGFDMELWNSELDYCEVESIVMSREHKDSDKIQFHVLDWYTVGCYDERCYKIRHWYQMYRSDIVMPGEVELRSAVSLLHFFHAVEYNYGEGICFRLPNSPYKQGRSTLREQYLVKLARFVRTEVVVVGFVEQQENCNRAEWNKVGMMDRSSCQSNMQGKNTLGAFVVRATDLSGDVARFTVGTGVGLTDKLRKEIWDNQDKYLGRVITVKHKPHGQKDLLRSPIFCGFREKGF